MIFLKTSAVLVCCLDTCGLFCIKTLLAFFVYVLDSGFAHTYKTKQLNRLFFIWQSPFTLFTENGEQF